MQRILQLALFATATILPGVSHAERFLPSGLTYAWWDFGVDEFEDFQIDITIHNDIDTKPGMYFQMYQGHIGGNGFYFGLQTDVYRPGKGGQGKGLIFSRWGTRSLSDVRATKDGWVQSAGYEGDFVGVRKNYPWSAGRYRLRLTAIDEDDVGVWYGFFILECGTNTEDYAGAIRFPKQDGKRPRIKNGGVTWTELYSGASEPEQIPRWHVSLDECFAEGRTVKPVHATSDYSKVPNTDIYRDEKGVIHFLMGKGVEREHPKGRLF